jgi:hypothetical protein
MLRLPDEDATFGANWVMQQTNGMKPASARSIMHNRRKVRLGLRVIHRHRVGRLEFRRVSELVFVRGRPKAILGWIDVGGMRSPIFLCDLDPAKLRKAGAGNDEKNTYYYDAVTVDPRYEELGPAEEDTTTSSRPERDR